jgi:hypothetical protein
LVKNQLKIKQLIVSRINKNGWLNQFYDSAYLIFKSMKPILGGHQLKKN